MDSVFLESPAAASPMAAASLGGPSFQPFLRESVDRFLAEVQKEPCDLSTFRSIFFRLLQSSVDPPLETIWFYSAVAFHESVSSNKGDAFSRLAAVKDHLQLLSACSASCCGAKSVALLAAAVSELCYCINEAEKLPVKEGKRARKEVECLVEGMLSYISICSSKSSSGRCSADDEHLLLGLGDLARVWTARNSAKKSRLEVLFPLISQEMRGEFEKGGCGVGSLAGAVIAEAFLLRLCLKIQGGGLPRTELPKELRIWVVSSITVFQNSVFFDILLRLLLDPPLPVVSLLSATDEILVRDILYDALILVDYSFITRGAEVQQYDSVMAILLRRLVITHEAIEVARKKGDQSRAMSYMNAFSTSTTPKYLVKWFADQFSLGKLDRPTVATPQALLKWLADLQDKGLRPINENISELCKRLIHNESKAAFDERLPVGIHTDAEVFFFYDKQGGVVEEVSKDDDTEMMVDTFTAAAQSMRVVGDRRTKRKDFDDVVGSQVKFAKYKKNSSAAVFDGMSSDSEVENPNSPSDDDDDDDDDEMEEKE